MEGEGIRSVFTRTLVQDLETGEADLDRDGFFSLDEVYDYVYGRLSDEQPEHVSTRIKGSRNHHRSGDQPSTASSAEMR